MSMLDQALPGRFQALVDDPNWNYTWARNFSDPNSMDYFMKAAGISLEDAVAFFEVKVPVASWEELDAIRCPSDIRYKSIRPAELAQFVADKSGKNTCIINVSFGDGSGIFDKRDVYLAYPNEPGKMEYYDDPPADEVAA